MKPCLAFIYFTVFAFIWPAYVINRSRGIYALAIMAAPWAAFFFGWFAK